MKQAKLRLEDYPFTVRPLATEDGGGYLIEFPDVPGCISDGETPEEAITNGRDALKSVLLTMKEFGDAIPQPRSLSAASGQWRQRVPRSLHSRLVTRAEQEGVSLNTLVTAMIAEGLGKRKASGGGGSGRTRVREGQRGARREGANDRNRIIRMRVEDYIRIQGAPDHNLKNISLSIPHEKLTVITGVSGSGKSSLAFDTIYAEGQRRYVESLSAYARQFLERMEKPDVDDIDGIAPAIAIRQKNTTRNPRSTVATSTECFDFLRLLYARVGQTFCPTCGTRVRKDTVDEVAARLLMQPEGSRWYALFPCGEHATSDALRDHLFELRKKGFNRLFQGGRLFEFSTPESLLDIDFTKPVFMLVDRVAIGPELHQRLVDTIEICYRESGEVIFESASGAAPLRFNERFQCKTCGMDFNTPEPILFSFNSPVGACPRCQGFGNTIDFDMNRVIPDASRSLDEGAVDPWTKPKYRSWMGNFKKHRVAVRTSVPVADLTVKERETLDEFIRRFFDYLERY